MTLAVSVADESTRLLRARRLARLLGWRDSLASSASAITVALAIVGVVVPIAAGAADLVSEQVAITGAVKIAMTLRVEDLEAFPPETIQTLQVMRHAEGKEIASKVKGVRLTALLERAGLAGNDKNEWKYTVVVASASDGYRVVYSWSELFNTDVGAGVLIVFERDGQPLADREGRISMVSARDLKGGPRNVRWLARLDVRVMAP